MYSKKKAILIFLFFSYQLSLAQSILPEPPEMQRTFKKQIRSKNGDPGKNYWQNTGYFGEVDHLIPWQIDHLINWRPVVENASRSDSKLVNKSYNYS